MLAFLLLTRLLPGASEGVAPEPPVAEAAKSGGGGYHSTSRTNKATREAAIRAFEAAEAAEVEGTNQRFIPPEPEAPKAAPVKAPKPAKRRDVAPDIAATQAAVVANTAMAEALAKVSDGIERMRLQREADDADELTALLLILAEV